MRLHKWMTAVLALVLLALPGLPLAQRADRFAAVAPRMQEFVDKGEAAGVVTLIATKDRVIHLAAVGKTDMAKDRKMRTDDIFWIASMSKPITAACIAILADDGKLKLDDPLVIYSRLDLNRMLLERAGAAGVQIEKARVGEISRGGSGWRLRTSGGIADKSALPGQGQIVDHFGAQNVDVCLAESQPLGQEGIHRPI